MYFWVTQIYVLSFNNLTNQINLTKLMLILLKECIVEIEKLFDWNVLPLFTKPLLERNDFKLTNVWKIFQLIGMKYIDLFVLEQLFDLNDDICQFGLLLYRPELFCVNPTWTHVLDSSHRPVSLWPMSKILSKYHDFL